MPFAKNNLPPASQQWAREMQSKVEELEKTIARNRENETALDAIVKANYQTTGVVQAALEDTLTYLRGLTFRYATFKSGAVWNNASSNTTEADISGTTFYVDLERRPKAASAFITVTCDVDLICSESAANSLMQQNISQYIYIQSYTGNPGTGAHSTTNVSTGQYAGYILGKSNTKSGMTVNAAPASLTGGSNITTTAGVYLNPAYTYRITTKLRKNTATSSSTARYGGNVSPQSMTIQITP